MAESLFKYSINSPENGSSNEEEEENSSFEVIHKSEAVDLKPVVVLLGWAGCQEKHLRKYTPMYEKKGYITITLIVPAHTLFFKAYKVADIAKRFLAVLGENKISRNPIIFHVFSNGGCMVYSQLTTLVHSAESEMQHNLSVQGVIFDSSPGKRRILNAVKAFMAVIQFKDIYRYLLGFCLLLYLCFTRFFRILLPGILGMEKGFQLYESISSDPARCPQLFLYSKADKLIMDEDVEEMMSMRKEKGVMVKSMCWEDTDHVSHLRTHPEVYTKTCLDFVEACLATRQEKNPQSDLKLLML